LPIAFPSTRPDSPPRSRRSTSNPKSLKRGGLHGYPKGYVPGARSRQRRDSNRNIAVHSWIASQAPELEPSGPLGRIRLLEAIAFISTELHNGFKQVFRPAQDRAKATDAVSRRLDLIARTLIGPYLFGERFTVADAYLFVILRWAN
jgi:glutathione S-transferase